MDVGANDAAGSAGEAKVPENFLVHEEQPIVQGHTRVFFAPWVTTQNTLFSGRHMLGKAGIDPKVG